MKRTTRSHRQHPARSFMSSEIHRALPKVIGEFVELLFLAKSAMEGFWPSKPYGDSRPYDFILDTGCRLLKIQIKSSSRLNLGKYTVRLETTCGHTYTLDEVDFVICYIAPADA